MRKSCMISAALAVCACLLTGCSGLEKEYVSVHDYVPSVQEQTVPEGRITVRNYSALKQALLDMAYSGKTEGSIVFDAAYDGDTTEDMASACWTVRTQDALCAYCVENIAYELNKVVTINEASVYISYSRYTEHPEDIKHLSFSSEAETAILDALKDGERKLTLLVGHSSFSADDMAAQLTKAYRENPTIVPRAPSASVNIFSGTGSQRLYEIAISYGLPQEELEQRQRQLESLAPFADAEPEELSEAERAYMACTYLMNTSVLSDDNGRDSAYDALIMHEADSEGLAFAYVELCHELGLNCRIVYGQCDWQEHCWNIVRLDGSYYHVDVTGCLQNGLEAGFLKNDESFWGAYRWDVSSYPKCGGSLRLEDLLPMEQPALPEQELPEETMENADDPEPVTDDQPTPAEQEKT